MRVRPHVIVAWIVAGALALLAIMLAATAFGAVVGEWQVNLQRSGRNQGEPSKGVTQEAAWADCQQRIAAQPPSLSTWTCQTPRYVARVVAEPSVCTAPQPAIETQPGQCPAGTVGNWDQSRAHITAPYPTCWTAGPWVPAEPPIDACEEPPPPTGNRPPVIVGTAPSRAVVGQLYVFAPSISDPDGDQLTIRVGTRPAGATVDALTGRLTFTPTSPGTVAPITLAVSDGRGGVASYSTPAIVVTAGPTQPPVEPPPPPPPAGTGTALLNWMAPTLRTDGAQLTDLTGYRIRYGRSAGSLNQVAEVGPVTTYTVTGLASGAWYFGVSAISASGEGEQSNIATKVVSEEAAL
jgi:hypothetical protein